jgi:hypothetical protein
MKNVPFIDNDPLQFDSQREVLFPNSGLTLGGHPAPGKMYAILPSQTVKKLQDDPKHLLVIDQHVLTASEATSYKQIFHNVSGSYQVPSREKIKLVGRYWVGKSGVCQLKSGPVGL